MKRDPFFNYIFVLFYFLFSGRVAIGGDSSAPQTPFSADGRVARTLRKLPHARVVSIARNSRIKSDGVIRKLKPTLVIISLPFEMVRVMARLGQLLH